MTSPVYQYHKRTYKNHLRNYRNIELFNVVLRETAIHSRPLHNELRGTLNYSTLSFVKLLFIHGHYIMNYGNIELFNVVLRETAIHSRQLHNNVWQYHSYSLKLSGLYDFFSKLYILRNSSFENCFLISYEFKAVYFTYIIVTVHLSSFIPG